MSQGKKIKPNEGALSAKDMVKMDKAYKKFMKNRYKIKWNTRTRD